MSTGYLKISRIVHELKEQTSQVGYLNILYVFFLGDTDMPEGVF